jgi:hypothetical protein
MKKLLVTILLGLFFTGCAGYSERGTKGGPPVAPSPCRWTSNGIECDGNRDGTPDLLINKSDGTVEIEGEAYETADVSTLTNLGVAPESTDELLLSDNGTNKALTIANLFSYLTAIDVIVDYDLLSADETYSGIPFDGIDAGETVTAWQLVYYDTTATEWLLADANAAGEWPAWGITLESGADGDEVMILSRGVVRYDTWNWTPGDKIYLSETAGGLTATAPSDDGDGIQPLGIAITADIVFFDIDPINGYYEAK